MYIDAKPHWDAADLANAIVEARQSQQHDAELRPLALAWVETWSKTDAHPSLKDIYFDTNWRGLAHAENGATMNLHRMPVGPLALNAKYYLTLYTQEMQVNEQGDVETVHHLDEFPSYVIPPFEDLSCDESMPHPTQGLKKEQLAAGDRLFTCVSSFGIELDNWARLFYEAYSLNQKFNNYRTDLDGCVDGVVYPVRNLGDKVADLALFERHLPALERIMGRSLEVEANPADIAELRLIDAAKRTEIHSVKLPTVIELTPQHQIAGSVHFGTDVHSGADVVVPIAKMGSILVAGQAGGGKSNFCQHILRQLVAQRQWVSTMKLVDYKGGIEFSQYADYPHVEVIERYEDTQAVVDATVAEMKARLQRTKGDSRRKSTEPVWLLAFDEFATVALHPAVGRAEKEAQQRLMASITQIALQGRAVNIRLLISMQRTTTDLLPAAISLQLQVRLCFRVLANQTVASMFGTSEDLDFHPKDLQAGQCIFDGGNGKFRVLQVPFIPEDLPLPPPPTAEGVGASPQGVRQTPQHQDGE